MKYLWLLSLAIALLILGGIGIYVKFGQRTFSCDQDVADLKKLRSDLYCTQDYSELICPYNSTYIQGFGNGCAISFLIERGWKKSSKSSD